MKRVKFLFLPVTVAVITMLVYFNSNIETKPLEVIHQTEASGRILQFGIYELVRPGKLVKSEQTTTGKAISKPTIQQVEQNDRIPAEKDVYFSYQYRLSNIDALTPIVNLKRVLKHPEITLPDGTKKTGSEYLIKAKVKRGEVFAFDGYAFNEDYEMVEGEWVFQIWYEDQKLVEQKFTSYKPETNNG